MTGSNWLNKITLKTCRFAVVALTQSLFCEGILKLNSQTLSLKKKREKNDTRSVFLWDQAVMSTASSQISK